METDIKSIIINLKEQIKDSDKILIGFGKEFEFQSMLMQNQRYSTIFREINEKNMLWIFPFLNYYFIKKEFGEVFNGLNKLAKLIEGKDYYVISTLTNNILLDSEFDKTRIVLPCGGFHLMQHSQGDSDYIQPSTLDFFDDLEAYFKDEIGLEECKIPCDFDSNELAFHSVYLDNYNEKGYMASWEEYTKWLQNTVNKKLTIMELGVGMEFPTVIRWPFEKIGFYNQKTQYYRVHKTLYHMSKDLEGRGYSISEKASSFICLL